MKLRKLFGSRACAGWAVLLVASGTAYGETTLRMRRATPRLAQAAQPAPAPQPQPPPPPAPTEPAAETTERADQPTEPIAPPPPPDEPVAAEPTEPTQGEVIVITGSRIGDPLGKQAPVRLMSREDLDRTGLVSVGEILQQLPVSGGAINGKYNSSGNFGAPPDGGGVGAGATEADLRYLGSKRVLVLVDGVRWVNGSSASGIAGATDLNTIPIGIIDRIEVLEDGASPIYGSDAIAGVINIITRKEFSGVVANAYTGGYHKGDGLTQKYDLTWGNTTPKMSLLFSASYQDQQLVESRDRDISSFPSPYFTQCTGGCSSATPQTRTIFTDPVTGMDMDITLNDGVGTPRYPTDYHTFATADRFNFAPFNLVLTPSRRMGAVSQVTYKLRPDVNVRGKALFNNRQSVNQAAPEPLFVGPGGGSGTRMDTLRVDATNPYNPFGFSFEPDSGYLIARRPIEAGPRKFEQNVNTFYVSGGLDGHIDAGQQRFKWDATLAYGLNRAEQRRNNSFNSAKLGEALGPAFLGSDGQYHCGTAANPGDPNCVPFNIFGGLGPDGRGTITPQMLAFTTFTEHDVSEQELFDVVANVTGNLVKLPAGWLAAAVGVEHRRQNGFFEPDAVVAAGDSADIPFVPSIGDFSVTEAYAELRAPLVAGSPGAELLDINAAARISDYSFLSPEVTGKLGARWKPTKDLILRASYGRGFRAPSIGERFGSKSRFDATLSDPCHVFNGDAENPAAPAAVKERCIAIGVPADGSYEQLNSQISVTTNGNRDLVPETSNSINVSAAYTPAALQDRPWVDTFDFELAYWDIRIDTPIAALDAQNQLDRCISGNNDLACVGIDRNAQGAIFSFTNQIENTGAINTRGLDLTMSYRSPRKNFGRFRATSQSSYLLAYDEKIEGATAGELETLERVGFIAGEPERAFPRFKSGLALSLLTRSLEATLTTRYIHSMTEECRNLSAFPGTCSDPNMNDNLSTNKLSPAVYNDVQVIWTPPFEPKLSVTAGVNNVLNRDPPACYSCSLNGFNGATYDVPGIFGYLSATYLMQ
jgi:iron complex outermembrane receptor protein